MQDLAILFKAVSDESRLRILNLLVSSGELCVCDIERVLDATQPKVSRHLKYLKKAGFVNDRREGLWMLYSIAEPLDSEHRLILSCVSRAAGSHAAGRSDLQRLTNEITSGCCTTFGTIKPAEIPLQLRPLKQSEERHV